MGSADDLGGDSLAFNESYDLLHRLHDEIKNGRGDEDEADDIREQMADLWYKLTSWERKRLDKISERLYQKNQK